MFSFYRFPLYLLCVFIGLRTIDGYSSGYDSCLRWPNHGTNNPGVANGFTITVRDSNSNTVNSYVGGQKYRVTLASTSSTCRGFVAVPFLGAVPTSFTGTRAGSFAPGATDTNVRTMSSCSGGITHSNGNTVNTYSWDFTAPAAGTGSITLWAAGIVTSRFGNNYETKLTLTENAPPSPSNSPTPTQTGTRTPTTTVSSTPSGTSSISLTSTPSPSSTGTGSITPSPTGSMTGTPSTTTTYIAPSASPTPTTSPSTGASLSSTSTFVPSVSSTPSPPLPSPSSSTTVTSSGAGSPISATASVTSTTTPTPTSSQQGSPTASQQSSPSSSPSVSSFSPSPTTSPSPSPGTCSSSEYCNDRGTCIVTSSNEQETNDDPYAVSHYCACNKEYSGTACERCGTGYVFDGGSNICVLDKINAEISITLTTMVNITLIGSKDSSLRTTVESQLAQSLAQTMNVSIARIIVRLIDGSTGNRRRMLVSSTFFSVSSASRSLSNALVPINMTITILPSVFRTDTVSSADAFQLLNISLSTPNNDLSTVFESTLGSAPIFGPLSFIVTYAPYVPDTVPCGDPSNSCAYPFVLSLTPRLSMAWNVDTVNSLLHFQIAFLAPSMNDFTWFAIAFNDNEKMIGGDAIVFEPSSRTVQRLGLGGYTLNSCPIVTTDTDTLIESYSSYTEFTQGSLHTTVPNGILASPSVANLLQSTEGQGIVNSPTGVLAVGTFTRRYVSSLPEIQFRTTRNTVPLRNVNPEEDTYIIYASGPKGILQLSSHSSETAGAVYVNLSEGGKAVPRMSFWIIVGHAIVGLVGLVLVLPLSTLVNTVGKYLPPNDRTYESLANILVGGWWRCTRGQGGIGTNMGISSSTKSVEDPSLVIMDPPKDSSSLSYANPRYSARAAVPSWNPSLPAKTGVKPLPIQLAPASPYVWWRRASHQLQWLSIVLVVASVIFGTVMTPSENRGKTLHGWISYGSCGILFGLGIVTKYLQYRYEQTFTESSITNTVWEKCGEYGQTMVHIIVIVSAPVIVYTGSIDTKRNDNYVATIIVGAIVVLIGVYIVFARKGMIAHVTAGLKSIPSESSVPVLSAPSKGSTYAIRILSDGGTPGKGETATNIPSSFVIRKPKKATVNEIHK